uniref:Uncharacterized protein TCIL3000_10_8700 n=1 Tax=Trypanosoma congolense (strain IL3000) TaxID=1068625 RepID=G0UXH7_TRYCI|nr:unnamed protein product [Trypanosoma congolense IL3000]
MLSTLFFDGADSTSALYVRTTFQGKIGDVRAQDAPNALRSCQAVESLSSGSIPVPSLRATLMWWLDRDASQVHILLVGDTIGDMSYCSRKLTVELHCPRRSIIACGVSHVRDQTVFAVSWVTSLLEAGTLRLQLQRSSDHHSHLLIVPDEQGTMTSHLFRVAASFESDALKMQEYIHDNTKESSIRRGGYSGPIIYGSFISSLPPSGSDNKLLAVVLLCNGFRIWRVNMERDGTFSEHEFSDTRSDACEGGGTHQSNGLSSWLPSWSWRNGGTKQRRYLAMSAVQMTDFFVLLRSNGSLELYDSSLSVVTGASPCHLSKEEVDFTQAFQWSALVGDGVHVITSFGKNETQRCVWARIPVGASGDLAPRSRKMAILPPTHTSALLGCVAVNSQRLALLWDVGDEEDSCVRCSLSVGSLMHANEQGLSAVLHILDAGEATDEDSESHPNDDTCLFLREAQTFFCHSHALHALTAVGDEMVLVEKVGEHVRAHVLTSDMSPLERLLETAFAITRPVGESAHNSLPLSSIHLIPAVLRENIFAPLSGVEAFCEGVELAASCAEAADHLSALLINAAHCVPVALTLGGFQVLRSASHLQGYTPSGLVDSASVAAAIDHATTYYNIPSRRASFCSYSRRFIQHTIARDFLLRIAYLLCSYIGWVGSDPDYGKSLELSRVRSALELLCAAYHSVSVTGPSTATIVPEVTKTVVDDVIRLFLQFKMSSADEFGDVIFVTDVAHRLRGCNQVLGPRACATWCNLLSRRYPCLQHFRVIRSLEVGRTSNSSQLAAMCLSATFHLAKYPAHVIKALLIDHGLILRSEGASNSMFGSVDVNEWHSLLSGGDDDTMSAVAILVYRVSLLRCIVQTGLSHHAGTSASLIREMFLTELVQLEKHVRESRSEYPGVVCALTELRLDTHLFLARAAIDDFNFGDMFHFLDDAMQCAAILDKKALYAERVSFLIGEVVENASSSDELTDSLVHVTHGSAELDGLVASKWFAYIGRLGVKGGTEELRLRAATGLYQYLCRRHAYGQAGRMMTDLVGLIRVSTMSMSNINTVLQLTSLAVTAVELIAPSAPLALSDDFCDEDTRESSAFSGYSSTGSPYSPDYVSAKSSMGREHLPWLRRRHYQAYCEQQLLKANRHVDCPDLWVENPPAAAYAAAVKRFSEVLMEARLWTEALRFASMAGYDVSVVLQNHVLDLMNYTDYTRDEEAVEEWISLVASCEEFSSSSNRYLPLRSTVITALLHNYEDMCPALLESLIEADRYEALRALLEAFEMLLQRTSSVARGSTDEEGTSYGASSSVHNDEEQSSILEGGDGYKPWLVLVEALKVGIKILSEALPNNGRLKLSDASMTVGVFDPMTRRAHELLNSPLLIGNPSLAHAEGVVREFLNLLEVVKRDKLSVA